MSDPKDAKQEKVCFVIAPIGQLGTSIWRRSNLVYRHVIEPTAQECGCTSTLRADMDPRPGMIGSQFINHLIYADQVGAEVIPTDSDHSDTANAKEETDKEFLRSIELRQTQTN